MNLINGFGFNFLICYNHLIGWFFLSYFLPHYQNTFTKRLKKMASEIDIFLAEKATGLKFATRLRGNVRSSIANLTTMQSGRALKTTVSPIYRDGFLNALTIKTPYYIYPILHYGFEGNKKKGIAYRLKARNILVDALENGKLVEDLGDAIGENRAVVLMNRIYAGFNIENT
jgi:hypothetical protein